MQSFCVFRSGGTRSPVQAMIRFVDERRQTCGIGLICKVLPIAPSLYYAYQTRQKILHGAKKTDNSVMQYAGYGIIIFMYGVHKARHQLRHEAMNVARYTAQHQFRAFALNRLWVSDFIYVSIWRVRRTISRTLAAPNVIRARACMPGLFPFSRKIMMG